jgi:hypothetical protein
MDAILEQILEIVSTDKSTYCMKTVCEGVSIDYHYLVTKIDIGNDEEMKGVMNLCLNLLRGHVLESFLFGYISQKEALGFIEIVESELVLFPSSLECMQSVVELLKCKFGE